MVVLVERELDWLDAIVELELIESVADVPLSIRLMLLVK